LQKLPVLYCSAAFQAGKQACSQAGNQAGWQVCQAGRQAIGKEGRKDGRKVGRKAGRQEGRNAGGQEFRQTDKCTERQMCKYVYRHREIKTYKTYTDKLTDRQCRSIGRQTDKQTDVQKVKRSNILCILRYIPTDRQTN
jgi:hypothetical protein